MPTPHSPLPFLSPADEAILTRLFEIDAPSLTDLFKSLSRCEGRIDGAPQTLLDLFRWSLRPEIKTWLDFHASEQSAAIRRRRIAKLEQIADTSKDLVEQRRACTTVLRALTQSPRRTTLHDRAGASPFGPSEPRPSGSGNLQPPAASNHAESVRSDASLSPPHLFTSSPVQSAASVPPPNSPLPTPHSPPSPSSPDSLLELAISHIQTPRDPASIAALAGALAPTAIINSSPIDPRTLQAALAALPELPDPLTNIDPPHIESTDTTIAWSSTFTYAPATRTTFRLELTRIDTNWLISSLHHHLNSS